MLMFLPQNYLIPSEFFEKKQKKSRSFDICISIQTIHHNNFIFLLQTGWSFAPHISNQTVAIPAVSPKYSISDFLLNDGKVPNISDPISKRKSTSKWRDKLPKKGWRNRRKFSNHSRKYPPNIRWCPLIPLCACLSFETNTGTSSDDGNGHPPSSSHHGSEVYTESAKPAKSFGTPKRIPITVSNWWAKVSATRLYRWRVP